MLKALIDLFKTKQEVKQPETPVEVPKEPAEVKEPIVESKLSEPSTWSPAPEPVPNFVVEVPVEIKLPPLEPAFVSEPVAVKDEIVIEKKPKRGRPKAGSKPKTKKK